MKIYFTGAISRQADLGDRYEIIVQSLKKMGHEVVAEHVIGVKAEEILNAPEAEQHRYYRAMLARISSCDMMVAEVSFPSTVHIGHELTLGLEKGKPVIALHQFGKRPVLFWGIDSEKFYLAEYTEKNLSEVLKDSIEYLSDQQDVRFNFFISPVIGNYLDWVAKKKRIPRAVYLRRLIEDDMKQNKEYQG